jgi:hypothetical protein
MNTRTLSAGLASVALISLALGCENGTPASRMLSSKAAGSSPSFSASASNHHMRWDIISVDFGTGTVSAGGVASARANLDLSKITLTGSGTFRSNSGNPQDVTGGGTWQTFNASGVSTGSGTYTVTGLVSFILAPGTFPLSHDNIGNEADVRAGLLVVQIAYSDGSEGTLAVSCHIVGTPDPVFEGVTASKGFVDYWNREAPPAPPGNANRTAFHVID